MARQRAYSDEEAKDIIALWAEIEGYEEGHRLARFGRKGTNPAMVETLAQEKGFKLASNGKPWARNQIVTVLQEAGKLAKGEEGPKKTSAGATRAPRALPSASNQGIFPGFDIFADFVKKDETKKTSAPNLRMAKISELSTELNSMLDKRGMLETYLDAANRKIARWEHRINLLMAGKEDPEDTEIEESRVEREESAEAVAVHKMAEAPEEEHHEEHPKKKRKAG
jgi:hypothetical protein